MRTVLLKSNVIIYENTWNLGDALDGSSYVGSRVVRVRIEESGSIGLVCPELSAGFLCTKAAYFGGAAHVLWLLEEFLESNLLRRLGRFGLPGKVL